MWNIREVRETELEKIAGLEKRIFSDAWSLGALKETFRQRYAVVLGAFAEDEPEGYVIAYCVAGEAEIVRIAVDERYRRQGAAAGMLAELEQRVYKKGGKRLLLDVREHNKAAVAFYRKCGFTEDGLRKNFYTNPVEHAILMSKVLL